MVETLKEIKEDNIILFATHDFNVEEIPLLNEVIATNYGNIRNIESGLDKKKPASIKY